MRDDIRHEHFPYKYFKLYRSTPRVNLMLLENKKKTNGKKPSPTCAKDETFHRKAFKLSFQR